MKLNVKELDHSLILCPGQYKEAILKKLSEEKLLCDVKFMTLQEFYKKKYFDHDDKALRYLKDEYGLSVSNAREILEAMRDVDTDKVYGIEKLDQFVAYRKKLEEEGLLICDPLFEDSIRDRKILVIGYGKLLKEDEKAIGGKVIEYERKEKIFAISEFSRIEEEVTYLYEQIQDLIFHQGVDINKIFVLNATGDYTAYFKRYNKAYPFEIQMKEDDSLYGTGMGKRFLEEICHKDRQELFDSLSENEDEISKKLISLINSYPKDELKDVKDLIEEDLKRIKIQSALKKDLVRCADLYDEFEEDDHVFLIGFNDAFPVLKKDIEYITDSLAKVLGLSIIEEKNALIRENVSSYLSGIEDLKISYSKKTPFHQYEISSLFEKDEYVLNDDSVVSTSYLINKARLSYRLDEVYRYGIFNEDISSLYQTIEEDDYRTYDNRFDGLRKDQIDRIDKVILSYSSMDTFYKCSFAYYLRNVLKVDAFDETFFTKLGTVCHDVLKDLFENKDFDFETSWDRNLTKLKENGIDLEDDKERYFFEKIKEELREDVRILLAQKEVSHLDRQKCENEFFVWNDRKIGFKGFIDKVMYKELDDEVIIDVIDYKTGNTAKIRESLMEFGLSMQLPSYMYLLKHSDLFKGKKTSYGGFYLQHLINSDLKYDEKKDAQQIKEESMKLEGYTTSDMGRLSYLDDSLEEGASSSLIKGLRLTKDGKFYASSKVISDEQIDALINLTDEKINAAGKAILEGRFDIDPKEIDGVNESCSFCAYKMICFRRYSDVKRYTTKEAEKEEEDA